MQTNLLWTGREYYSLENCLVTATGAGFEIDSVIVGLAESRLYRVEYSIKTNQHWQTIDCQLKIQLDNEKKSLHLQHDGKGNWTANSQFMAQYQGCTDVDIPSTPFTNTLPINRLNLVERQTQLIQVVYIDVLAYQTVAVQQRYTRLSATSYHYENVPNDFEATITVDGSGLVVDYPGLFIRTAHGQTSYP